MKNNKKSPTGAPLGNPIKFFREGGEKIKAMYKKGGYNVPVNALPKKLNGGPGSGMGSMYAADQAFDAMMNQPTSSAPKPSSSIIKPPMTRSAVYDKMRQKNPGLTQEQIESYMTGPRKNKKGGSVKNKKR
jgi:hypothetical protein